MTTSSATPADPELSEILDRSFGDGPAPAPVAERLRAGRRSLRRRRGSPARWRPPRAVALVATVAFADPPGHRGVRTTRRARRDAGARGRPARPGRGADGRRGDSPSGRARGDARPGSREPLRLDELVLRASTALVKDKEVRYLVARQRHRPRGAGAPRPGHLRAVAGHQAHRTRRRTRPRTRGLRRRGNPPTLPGPHHRGPGTPRSTSRRTSRDPGTGRQRRMSSSTGIAGSSSPDGSPAAPPSTSSTPARTGSARSPSSWPTAGPSTPPGSACDDSPTSRQ